MKCRHIKYNSEKTEIHFVGKERKCQCYTVKLILTFSTLLVCTTSWFNLLFDFNIPMIMFVRA